METLSPTMWGALLLVLEAVGVVLVSIGAAATFVRIFGLANIPVLESVRPYTLIGFGLALVIIPACTAESGAIGHTRAVKRSDAQVERTGHLEQGATISEEYLQIDLRHRKQIGPVGYFGGELSESYWFIRKVINVVQPGKTEVHFRHATSGYAIEPIDMPGAYRWRIVDPGEQEILSPFVDLLRGVKGFKELLAREGKMRTYYMTVPITSKGQEIVYKLRYYNAFQGPTFEWMGRSYTEDTQLTEIRIHFPDNKPYQALEAYKRTATMPKTPIGAPEIEESPDHLELKWIIRNAKKGEDFFLKWSW